VADGPQVPDAPELAHRLGSADRNANVFLKARKRRREKDAVLLELLDDLVRRPLGIHQHEIRLGVDRPQHPRVGLIQELLAVVGIAPRADPRVLPIVERSGSGVVVPPNDPEALVEAARTLYADEGLRAELGGRARSYAETTFDLARIADRFEQVLERVER